MPWNIQSGRVKDTFSMDFYEWVEFGKDSGWCSDIVCDTHEGLPMTDQEMENWGLGEDDCIPAIRIW